MIEVELEEAEIKALDALMKDATANLELGYVLGVLRRKIVKAWQESMNKQQKEAAKGIVKADKKLLKELVKELEE